MFYLQKVNLSAMFDISAPTGRLVPVQVDGNSQAGFRCEYECKEIGGYKDYKTTTSAL